MVNHERRYHRGSGGGRQPPRISEQRAVMVRRWQARAGSLVALGEVVMGARLAAGSTVMAIALGLSALVAAPSSADPISAEGTSSAVPPRWKVSAGGAHTCGVREDGSLWCWGSHGFGQLGLGDDRTDRLVPTRVGTDGDWAKVSSGSKHTCGCAPTDPCGAGDPTTTISSGSARGPNRHGWSQPGSVSAPTGSRWRLVTPTAARCGPIGPSGAGDPMGTGSWV